MQDLLFYKLKAGLSGEFLMQQSKRLQVKEKNKT